jgi:uncharacterized protein YndB with AHSA1/START domain
MPRHAAARTLLAPLEDVWAFLAEPYNLADWWPGIGGVEPDRRGLAPGARWKIRGSDVLSGQPLLPPVGPGMFKRPGSAGTVLITEVDRGRRLAFQLVNEHIDAEIELESAGRDRTAVRLVVQAPWGAVRRSYAQRALMRLFDLVRTGENP